jgi:protein gp37
MGATTKIQWTDHTASPWYGCAHRILPDGSEHPGCGSCYAEAMARRNPTTLGIWGPAGTRVVSKSFAKNCRKWNDQAMHAGQKQTVFPSVCDPFEDWTGRLFFADKDEKGKPANSVAWWRSDVGICTAGQTTIGNVRGERLATMSDAIHDLFNVIDACPWLIFLLLTKRPENILRMWPAYSYHACETGDCPHDYQSECDADNSRWFRDNVWLGTSVSDQATADAMLPQLRRCGHLCPVLFVSYEPALGPVYNGGYCPDCGSHADFAGRCQCADKGRIGQWIYGGESGPKARPNKIDWGRRVLRGCRSDGAAFFGKQLGAYVIDERSVGCHSQISAVECWPAATRVDYDGRVRVRDPKGADPLEWPEDMRARECPRMDGEA